MGRKAAFHNLGCKVNSYETDAMRQSLLEAGYEEVPFAPGAEESPPQAANKKEAKMGIKIFFTLFRCISGTNGC